MAYVRSRKNIRRPSRSSRRVYPKRRTYVRARSRVGYGTRRSAYQRRSRRVQSAGMSTGCCSVMDPGQKFVMVQADPFEPKYFGAKIPDSSTIPSIPTPIQYNQTLQTLNTSQPAFAHAWAFYPSVSFNFITALGLNASQWSFSAASATVQSAPQSASFQSQFEAFRPTAHAIRLTCPFAPTTTTGFVHIAIATETNMTAANTNTQHYTQLAESFSAMSGYTFYKRVTLASLTQSPITLINKWTDETAFRYQSPVAGPAVAAGGSGGANQFQIPFSWGTLLIAVEGVSTSTTPAAIAPLTAEVILHSECIPDKSSTLIGSTAASYSSSTLNAVSQAVAATDFSHTEEQQDRTIGNYVAEVANAAGLSPRSVRDFGIRVAGQAVRTAAQYATSRGASAVAQAVGVRLPPGLPGVNYPRLTIS